MIENMAKKYYELFDKIQSVVNGKDILDIGCVDHKASQSKGSLWVHAFLKKHAKHLLGIDISKKEVEILKQKGYNVDFGDAENFKFNKKFEIIFAGELIEHLSNQGKFLENCKNNLKKEGVLILTTPSSFNLQENIKNVLFMKTDPAVNNQHTCYYTPTTIKQLIERHGFIVDKIDFFDFYGSFFGKIKFKILSLFGDIFKRRMVIYSKLK